MNALTITTKKTSAPIVLRGKTVGTKYEIGTGSIAGLRKQLREAGLSANEANRKISEFLKGGGGNLAWADGQTMLEAARLKGHFPTSFELRDGTFCLRGAAAPTVKEAKSAKSAEQMQREASEAMAAKHGYTVAEMEAILAAAK